MLLLAGAIFDPSRVAVLPTPWQQGSSSTRVVAQCLEMRGNAWGCVEITSSAAFQQESW
jgi:hypothetical protein